MCTIYFLFLHLPWVFILHYLRLSNVPSPMAVLTVPSRIQVRLSPPLCADFFRRTLLFIPVYSHLVPVSRSAWWPSCDLEVCNLYPRSLTSSLLSQRQTNTFQIPVGVDGPVWRTLFLIRVVQCTVSCLVLICQHVVFIGLCSFSHSHPLIIPSLLPPLWDWDDLDQSCVPWFGWCVHMRIKRSKKFAPPIPDCLSLYAPHRSNWLYYIPVCSVRVPLSTS